MILPQFLTENRSFSSLLNVQPKVCGKSGSDESPSHRPGGSQGNGSISASGAQLPIRAVISASRVFAIHEKMLKDEAGRLLRLGRDPSFLHCRLRRLRTAHGFELKDSKIDEIVMAATEKKARALSYRAPSTARLQATMKARVI